MKGLIVSSGSISNYKTLESLIKDYEFIIGVDGGVDHLLKIKHIPNLIVGDLDSISKSSFEFIKDKNIPIIKFPSKKDSTDTELAMEYLIENGYKEITLTGVTGTRLDHTLANIYLLNLLLEKNIKGKIVDEHNTIYLIDDHFEIDIMKNTYVSIIPITMEGIIVSLSGFAFKLVKKFISFGSTEGISNEIVDDKGIIQIHRGKALLFLSKD